MKKILPFLFVVFLLQCLYAIKTYAQDSWPRRGNSFLLLSKHAQLFYITGLCDAIEFYSSSKGNPFPSYVTYEQVRYLVEKYLNEHPEERHNTMPIITLKAIRQAFDKSHPGANVMDLSDFDLDNAQEPPREPIKQKK